MNEKYRAQLHELNETEKNITKLRELFKDSPDNVFVRGSVVRGGNLMVMST